MNGVIDFISGLFANPVIQKKLPEATLETLSMVGLSTVFTAILGLPLGFVLSVTSPGGLRPNAFINRVLGFIVNVGRSLPFIILMIALIPFTRWVAGTSLGWEAAVVPLTVGAIPFFARLVETSAREVDGGKIDAARVMGSSDVRIVRTVLFREALPSLVSALTVTIVALISYSAMAGAVGGGGLGFLAISYGYSRYQSDVMLAAVVVIVVIVQVIQVSGDAIARGLDHRRPAGRKKARFGVRSLWTDGTRVQIDDSHQ